MTRIIIIIAMILMSLSAYAIEPPSPPRDVFIRGEITDEMAFAVVDRIRLFNLLDNSEITLHISSGGGSVYAGLMIYDAMQGSVAHIKTSCEGFCASMSALLLALGDTRESSSNATIMFHELSLQTAGKLTDGKRDMLEGQRLQNLMNKLLAARTGLFVAFIADMISYDHYFSPSDAKKLNIIDTVKEK